MLLSSSSSSSHDLAAVPPLPDRHAGRVTGEETACSSPAGLTCLPLPHRQTHASSRLVVLQRTLRTTHTPQTMSLPSRVTRSTLSSLYNSYIHTAQSFQSYNFREYFLRISDRKFGEELSKALNGSSSSSSRIKLEDIKAAAASSSSSSSSSSSAASPSSAAEEEEDVLANITPEQKEKFKAWWTAAQKDLEQLKRSAVVNSLFIAPRLVVEGRGNVMSHGGGGAGMEARWVWHAGVRYDAAVDGR